MRDQDFGAWVIAASSLGLCLAPSMPSLADPSSESTDQVAVVAKDASPDNAAAAHKPVAVGLHQPISANFREVDFESAIGFLAESTGVQIVVSEKATAMSKPVTLRLVEIPLQRALEYVVKGQGLVYRADEHSIFVSTIEEMEAEPLETKVFFLNQGPGLHASFEPLAETRDSVALQATGIRRLTTIKDILSEVVPQVTGSSMMLDERTGALIVTHVPYYLHQIEELLEKIDVQPTEVRIEARFIELTLTDTKEWNFDMALNADTALTKVMTKDGSLGPGLQLSSTGSTLRRGTKIDFSDFSRQTSGEALNFTLQGVLTGTQYAAVNHPSAACDRKNRVLRMPGRLLDRHGVMEGRIKHLPRHVHRRHPVLGQNA